MSNLSPIWNVGWPSKSDSPPKNKKNHPNTSILTVIIFKEKKPQNQPVPSLSSLLHPSLPPQYKQTLNPTIVSLQLYLCQALSWVNRFNCFNSSFGKLGSKTSLEMYFLSPLALYFTVSFPSTSFCLHAFLLLEPLLHQWSGMLPQVTLNILVKSSVLTASSSTAWCW